MRIKRLKINNFRNFVDGDIDINEGTTVFYGGVGAGKTNIIEAVFLLSMGRSHRTAETHQMIKWGKNEAYVRAEGQNSTGQMSVAIKVTKTGKRIELNGDSNRKTIELIGGLKSVMLHAEDLGIVSGGPHMRRRYLDLAISQSSKNYTYNLRDYYRILKQRNSALSKHQLDSLAEWDAQLSTIGAWITKVRAEVINDISKTANQAMKSLVGSATEMDMKYLFTGDDDAERYRFKLARTIQTDAARGATTIGPHRDDVKITLSGVDSRHYASSGEKKTIVLALKLAEVDFIRRVTGEKPIMLLDDVFSTLDIKRSRALLSVTGDGSQCIITLTDMNLLNSELKSGAKLYEVEEGRIKQAI